MSYHLDGLPQLMNKWLVRKLTDKDKLNPNPLDGQKQPIPDPKYFRLINDDRNDTSGYYDEYPRGVPGEHADNYLGPLWQTYLKSFPNDKSKLGWHSAFTAARDAITHRIASQQLLANIAAATADREALQDYPPAPPPPKVPLQDYPPALTRKQVMEELTAHNNLQASLESTFQNEIRAALKAHEDELILLDSRIWELEKAGHSSLGQMRSDRKSVAFKMPRRLMAGKKQ